MHLSSFHDLYSFYALEHKSDAYVAYLYLKHLDHFIAHVYASLGLPARPPVEPLDGTLDDLLTAYVAQIAEAAPSLETNIYHGKVLTLKDAVKLVAREHPLVLPPPSERVLPWRIARDVILEGPPALAVGTCACRQVAEQPCLPPEEQAVCLILGEPFVSFIVEHNPRFRRIAPAEAVAIVQASHERGEVHAGYFKKEMGGRLFALCNCCSCCCVGVRMWNLLEGAIPFLAPSGYVSRVGDACDGCGLCAAPGECPFGALGLDDAAPRARVDREKCMGCGACERVCPRGALTLERAPDQGDPLDVEALARAAATPA